MIKQEKHQWIVKSLQRPIEASEPPADTMRWMEQPKLNGVFARWDPTTQAFYSKRGIIFHRHLIPELYDEMIHSRSPHPLDGELWHEHLTLQQITGALGHERDYKKELPHSLRYVLYDYVPTHKPLMRYVERHETLKVFAENNDLDFIDHHYALTDTNCDGTIYRYINGIYKPGQGGNVLKVKSWKELDAIVVTPELGTGGTLFQNVMGALRCTAQIKGRTVEFYVGSGFTHEERIEFLENPPSKIKVRYLHLSPDGFPLNPSYLGIDI